jgi:hypothetical protein
MYVCTHLNVLISSVSYTDIRSPNDGFMYEMFTKQQNSSANTQLLLQWACSQKTHIAFQVLSTTFV